ncbi:transport permease protein [Ktedonobacter sp. SOSP1-52]|uniref:ABC transporter permease n=1 Tax=Ktedonobacter sp. SOSP1-52 TaxID=2778366 RepID=UPI0019151788|nr:ABC transporter permease [Ktedonobacter sp. SOSP1-52]GHO65443.1 transport permease protein [Ktedonobacter sp. SOSP1-52]
MAQAFDVHTTSKQPIFTLFGDTGTLYRRVLLHMFGEPGQLIFSLAQPLVWFFFFGQLFSRLTTGFGLVSADGGNALATQFGTESYTAFFLPAIIVQVLLFGPVNSALGLITDEQSGYLNKLRVTPINRFSIMLGNLLADLTRMMIQVVIVLVVGLVSGVRIAHPELLPLLFVVAALFGLFMGGLWLFIGLSTRSAQATYLIFSLISLPLLFTSSAQLPIGLLPGWLQFVARYNPVTYAVNAIRVIVVGVNAWQKAGGQAEVQVILTSIVVLLIPIALTLTLGVLRFRKQLQ